MPAVESWTTARLLRWMREHFETRGVEPARIVAEMLLAETIGCERLRLYMEPERPASPEEREHLRTLVRRASEGEPVQYLVGWTQFLTHRLAVAPCTLVPQPCTEELVGLVVDWARSRAEPPACIGEVGTGTGCIAIALARALPAVRIVAGELVPEAAALAERNAAALGTAERVQVVVGHLLEPLRARRPEKGFDALVANLPYIPDAEWNGGQVEDGVRRFVAESALRGGADGLDLVRPFLQGAPALLAPGGLVAAEVADAHAETAASIARDAGLHDVRVVRDAEGYKRFVIAERERE